MRGSGVHHCLDDGVADCGVPADPVDVWDCRAPDARIRGDGQRGDHHVVHRLADLYADALRLAAQTP